MIKAPTMVSAREPTAGPTLFGDVVSADVERHVTARSAAKTTIAASAVTPE